MSFVGVGLIGLGTVGTGVARILKANASGVSKRVGAEVRLVRVSDKFVKSCPEAGIPAEMVTADYRDLLKDESIDVIVELVGGYEPARTMILEALHAGKHVVTANKAVLAKYWDEILTAAGKNKRLVYFEAAVGGGIPVIQGLNEGLAANRIKEIVGILNGTTNYILTRMEKDGLSFSDALKQAQKAGFAEADPTFDIQGIDTAHKIAILASIAFGGWVRIEDVKAEGIDGLDLFDLKLAEREFEMGLKLLGIARPRRGKVEVRVHPSFLPLSHPFANVQNEYNAISIDGDAAGDVMFYGKGAGQMPAASAVASDLIFVARHVFEGTAGRLPYVTYDKKKVCVSPIEDFESKFYLRFNTADKPGVLSKITGVLGRHGVSIASVWQSDSVGVSSRKGVPIVLVTHVALEGKVRKALAEISRLSIVRSQPILIHIYGEDHAY